MKPKPQPLQPGDYYFNDQGLMVFTAQYHLRRGSCCGSGCRHCPYKGRSGERNEGEESSNKRSEQG